MTATRNEVVAGFREHLARRPRDHAARLALAELLLVGAEADEAYPLLESTYRESPLLDLAGRAAFVSAALPAFRALPLSTEFRSLEEIAGSLLPKKRSCPDWPEDLIAGYRAVLLRAPEMRTAPLALLEVGDHHLYRHGDLPEAESTYRDVLRLFPGGFWDAYGSRRILEILLKKARGVQAELREEKILQEYRGKSGSVVEIARTNEIAARREALLAETERFAAPLLARFRQFPAVREILLEFAEALSDDFEKPAARLDFLERFVDQCGDTPETAVAHGRLALGQFALGRESLAFPLLKNHLTLYPEGPNQESIRLLYARLLLKRGESLIAVEQLSRILPNGSPEARHDAAETCLGLVKSALSSRDFEGGLLLLDRFEAVPFDERVRAEFAFLAATLDKEIALGLRDRTDRSMRFLAAQKRFEAILEDFPDSPFAALSKLEAYEIASGKVEEHQRLDRTIQRTLIGLLVTIAGFFAYLSIHAVYDDFYRAWLFALLIAGGAVAIGAVILRIPFWYLER